MSKALFVLLLSVSFSFTFAQRNDSLSRSFFVQQSTEGNFQLQIPVNVLKNNSPKYSFDTLLQLEPTKGYDADKDTQSIEISEIQVFADSKGTLKTRIIGKLHLNCCFGVIARVDLQDRLGNTIESTNTNDKGEFSIKADHNQLLSENRKDLTLRFGKIRILDITGNTHEYRVKKVL